MIRAFTSPFQIVAIVASLVAIGALFFVLGVIVWRSLGRGRPIELAEEAKKFWGDVDETAASIRSMLYLVVGALNVSLMALLIGFFGRSMVSESSGFFGYSIFSTLAFIALWWVEREFAWPGLLLTPEVRGTRGLFFARRDKRRHSRTE